MDSPSFSPLHSEERAIRGERGVREKRSVGHALSSAAPLFLFGHPHQKRGGQGFVEGEKVFDALTVTRKRGGAIEFVNGGIVGGVRLAEFEGHGARVVEIGERGSRIEGAGVENSVGALGEARPMLVVQVGQGEIIINDADGVEVTALKSAADLAHPRIRPLA